FGPLEFLAARQPGVHGSTDAKGRFALEGLPAVPQMEILALAPQGKAQQPIDLAARDLDGIRLQLAAQGTVSGVVLDQRRQPIADARVAAATGTPHGRWSAAVRTDEQGRFRIEGLATGALTLSALGSAGAIEMKAGRLEQGGVRDVELVLAQGGSVAGVARLPNGKPAAAVPVFAFASQSNGAPWSHPTASCSTNADGSYHLAPLPEGEVVVRVVNPGDDPFAGLPGRSHRRDRAFVVLSAGESKTGVDLVVSRNDLTISGRVVDADGRPVAGAALNAIPNGDGAAVPRARTLSQVDGQFLIEGLSEGPHTIVVTQGDQSDMRREGVPAGSAGIELRLEKYGSLDGVVVDSSGRPVPTFVVVARPLLGPNPSEPDLRSHWGRPQLRAEILSQPDGAFRLPAVPAATYEIVAFGPDHSVATLHPLVVAAGEPRHNLRLTTRPGATIRGRVVDHRTGLPIAGARAEGRGTAHGLITGATNADGWFSLSGLPAGNVADFAVTGPGAAYITDCQHRAIPADGTTVEIGEVRLFPGPVLKLTMAGQVATGLWFHSREGRPMVPAVAADSIAAAAGARPGELVLAVDGSDVRKLSSSVVEGLVATGGPTVNLTVQAPGSRSTRTLSVAHVDPAAR
ncbi:MAG TPA: carboxypeptidase-like regulatory domain-containing protein, partial [Polyangia bacterium]